MKTTTEELGELREVAWLVEHIAPLLAGYSPLVQGAALADCLAMWLAGHHVEGNEAATAALRADLLSTHLQVVRQLTAVNARSIGTTP